MADQDPYEQFDETRLVGDAPHPARVTATTQEIGANVAAARAEFERRFSALSDEERTAIEDTIAVAKRAAADVRAFEDAHDLSPYAEHRYLGYDPIRA